MYTPKDVACTGTLKEQLQARHRAQGNPACALRFNYMYIYISGRKQVGKVFKRPYIKA